jgi:hypothetical protein
MFLFSDASKTSQRLGNLSQAVYTSAQRVDVTSLDEGCRYGSMRETIVKIRELLGELEQDAESSADATERALVSGLELPDIIRDVVDLLFPQLKPYEAFLYMYMFRHSVVETGTQLMRVSRRRLTSGVVKSQFEGTRSGGGAIVSATTYRTVQSGLDSLETIGAIRREAEPTREGTLYRVLLPEEIEVCRQAREARAAALPSPAVDELREVDYYNVRENRQKVYERDNYHCRYCQKQLTRFTATLDHVQPVAEGGDNSFGNLVTACLDCNSRKNVRPLGDFLAERVVNPT